jgi:hypothetical protein
VATRRKETRLKTKAVDMRHANVAQFIKTISCGVRAIKTTLRVGGKVGIAKELACCMEARKTVRVIRHVRVRHILVEERCSASIFASGTANISETPSQLIRNNECPVGDDDDDAIIGGLFCSAVGRVGALFSSVMGSATAAAAAAAAASGFAVGTASLLLLP